MSVSLGHNFTERKPFSRRKLCENMHEQFASQSASHSLATLLVEIRKHFRKSQAYIARHSGYSQALISRIENANHTPSYELVSAYLQLTGEDSSMRRRLLLTAAAAGITGPLIADDAIAHAVDQTLRPDVDAWDARIAALGRDNMRYGSAVMRPRIGTALAELLNTPSTGKLGPHLARTLMLYARTEPNPYKASTGYKDATDAAVDTDDPTTIAWTFGRAALAAGGEQETAHLTEGYAERAIATGQTGDPLAAIGVYLAYAALARGWANLGHWDNTLTYCDQAMRAYEHVDPDADGSEYTYSASRHAITMAYPLYLIGHPDAAQWSRQARELGATGRFITHLDLQEAIGLHREGDPAGADAARAAMNRATGDTTTLILRTMAAQAGAHEYAPTN